MTNWRAVGVGFIVLVLASLVAIAVQGFGHLMAGLAGGFAAGYVDGRGMFNGAWHGLVTGGIAGIVLALAIGIGSVPPDRSDSLIFGGFVFSVLLIPSILALGSVAALAGLIGGWFGQTYPIPTR